ncbi:hypothetical protein [Roseovarius sp. 2305UL8-3]|uniref:hypothetical protein n=1 Tax=Roseovarius conchicola TaxID=3121636 RepID=UPI003527B591
MRLLPLSVAALMLSAGTVAAEFSISFEWGDIPSCTSGRPNTVGSPAFVIKDLPAGTTSVQFRLKDLNVPNYKHGGGKVKVTGDGKMPFGVFKYKSPCPPSGAHTYQWTATAKGGGKTLGKATAQRKYPE